MEFISQPFSPVRLGDFLLAHLGDPEWTTFRAAIAFVKRSGTRHLVQRLEEFSNRAAVRITVGIDHAGTSREGLLDLLHATPRGEVWIYRNNGPFTFHPKVYMFRNDYGADLLIGSANLTGGGLFTNYEASLAASLDLTNPEDVALLQHIEGVLDGWSHAQQGTCYLLTPEFLDQLAVAGLLRTEAQLAAMQQAATGTPTQADQTGPLIGGAATATPPFFITIPVPPAPAIPTHAEAEAEAMAETAEADVAAPAPTTHPLIVPATMGGYSSFVLTLENTDVGVGQTTPGTSRRSPEVFIPLAAFDYIPGFWGFPDLFTPDDAWNAKYPQYRRNGYGKMDRYHVPMRIGTIQDVSMFFNPRKKDFRLRNEALRSLGNVGDLLLVQAVSPVNGFIYDVQVAPQGSPLYNQLLPRCNIEVGHGSQKLFGYF
jgi:hypothetical protein